MFNENNLFWKNYISGFAFACFNWIRRGSHCFREVIPPVRGLFVSDGILKEKHCCCTVITPARLADLKRIVVARLSVTLTSTSTDRSTVIRASIARDTFRLWSMKGMRDEPRILIGIGFAILRRHHSFWAVASPAQKCFVAHWILKANIDSGQLYFRPKTFLIEFFKKGNGSAQPCDRSGLGLFSTPLF